MKKLIIFVLVCSLILLMFAGCGKQAKTGTNPTASPTDNKNSKSPDSRYDTNTETPASELTDFITRYTESKTDLWDTMSSEFEKAENLSFIFGSLAFLFADLSLLEILFFDTLLIKDGDSYKGKILFTNIEAWKKYKGDIIEFGYDYIYDANSDSGNKEGDRRVAVGKLDKKIGFLSYENTTERNGKIIDRTVVEISRNSNQSYSCQLLVISDDKNTLTGYYTWYDDENIITIIGEKENSAYDFTYDSLAGKKNIKPQEMAENMKVKSNASFIDGKATYEAE